MFEIGLSTCGRLCTEELFAEYARVGIKNMEISLSKDNCDALDFKAVYDLAKKYGVRLWSFHLPFMPFSVIDISSPELQKQTLDYLYNIIDKGVGIGIDKFIVHPSGEPIGDDQRSIRLETAKESLAALAEYASKYNAVIAVEDLPRTCLGRDSAEILELIGADERLRVCLDTNHLLSEELTDFIARVGDKIITTHVSDYDKLDEKHWLPGEGVLDWQAVVGALKAKNYTGPWLYEVDFGKPRIIVRQRDLVIEDIARNADEIFNGLPLTKI